MSELRIRALAPDDWGPVTAAVDEWWGGRPMRAMLPRLFFEHFNPTSFAVGEPGQVMAFLVGFVSQTDPRVAYIHFVGVSPAMRGQGVGRALYRKFFDAAVARGCTEVQCLTSPVNPGSIAFHRRMGFEMLPGDGAAGDIPVWLNHGGPGQHRVRFRKLLAGA